MRIPFFSLKAKCFCHYSLLYNEKEEYKLKLTCGSARFETISSPLSRIKWLLFIKGFCTCRAMAPNTQLDQGHVQTSPNKPTTTELQVCSNKGQNSAKTAVAKCSI